MSDAAWTWTRRECSIEGYPDDTWVEWHGDGPGHLAVVTSSEVGGQVVWQASIATVSAGDQRSPYRRTRQAAQAWAERYGQRKPKRARARRQD
jgi:hypothetical protein